MCSASFGTVPERSRAPRGGGRNSPASGEYLPPRTLDGEDPFRILVAQGKGAASSSLPQADSSFRLPPRSVLSNRAAEFSSYIHCRPPPQFFVFAARLPYALYMWTHAESGAGWYSIKTGRCPSQNRPYTLPCGQPRPRSRPDIGEDKREGLQCPIPPLRGPPAGASAFNLVPVPFQPLCLI